MEKDIHNVAIAEPWPLAEATPTIICHDCGARILRDQKGACPHCVEIGKARKEVTRIERRDAKRSQASSMMLQRMVSLAKADGSSADIVAGVEETLDQLGGVKGWATRWAHHIERALDDKSVMPGLKALNDFAKVMIAIAPRVERKSDFRELTDEELEQEYHSTVFREAMLRLAE